MTPVSWKPWRSSGKVGAAGLWPEQVATSYAAPGGCFHRGASSVSPQFFIMDTQDPLQCISDERPVWHGAGMPHVLTSHHHFLQNICQGHCQADGSPQICQKQVKTEVQFHGSAGEEKEEETITHEW